MLNNMLGEQDLNFGGFHLLGGQGDEAFGQLGEFPWQLPGGPRKLAARIQRNAAQTHFSEFVGLCAVSAGKM